MIDEQWDKEKQLLKETIQQAMNSSDPSVAYDGRDLMHYYIKEYESTNFFAMLEHVSYRINGGLVDFYTYACHRLNELGFYIEE